MTTVLATIVVGLPDMELAEECPECGFDALLTFPPHLLSEGGVGTFGTYRGCARCYDMEDES